jgi:hypothetical protein
MPIFTPGMATFTVGMTTFTPGMGTFAPGMAIFAVGKPVLRVGMETLRARTQALALGDEGFGEGKADFCAGNGCFDGRDAVYVRGRLSGSGVYRFCRFLRILTKEPERSSSSVRLDSRSASASVSAPQLIARRK